MAYPQIFIASVDVHDPPPLFTEEKVYIMCCGYSAKAWRLGVLNSFLLTKQDKEAAINFQTDHNLNALPELPPLKTAYAAEHHIRLAKLNIVGIANYGNEKKWECENFFYPKDYPANIDYVQRMKKEGVLPAARGALFHRELIKMTGETVAKDGFTLTLDDQWQGFLKLNATDFQNIEADVLQCAAAATDQTTEYTTWLANAKRQKGTVMNSDMLMSALTPPRRARLYLLRHPAARDKEVRAFAVAGWQGESTTEVYYRNEVDSILQNNDGDVVDHSDDLSIAKGLAAAKYIAKRLESIETGKKSGNIVKLLERGQDRPMFEHGFYSAMQEARRTSDGDVEYATMPQLIASGFVDRTLC